MYSLDQEMISTFSIPSSVLMENAARSVYTLLFDKFPDLLEKKVLVVVGPGANGEDGLVLSRQLAASDVEIVVLILPLQEDWSPSLSSKINTLRKLSVRISNDLEAFSGKFDIIIDAIFGIGLSRAPQGMYQQAINFINQSRSYVVSLDIPSGVNAFTGMSYGELIDCDVCVSFGNLKIGNLLNNGYAQCAELFVSSLLAPYNSAAVSKGSNVSLNLPAPLFPREKTGYKNTFGKCLVVGGSQSYHGAPYFAAGTFMKAGGGYVHLVSTEKVTNTVVAKLPECVIHPYPATPEGTLPHASLDEIERIGSQQNALILGPGLGISPDTKHLTNEIINSKALLDVPLVIDGDALTILSNNLELLRSRQPFTTFLTPHLGEMATLTGCSIPEIEENIIAVIKEFSTTYQVNLLVKGPRSCIATSDGVFINTTGTDALATAGSGDVLAGIIAALVAPPNLPADGFRNAIFLHGLIGNILSEKGRNRTATASDILCTVPDAIRQFENITNAQKNRMPLMVPGIRFID